VSVPFNDPTNAFYDLYSIDGEDLVVPSHFNWYEPDNRDDFFCTAVISAAPERGAKSWTMGGKWVTIGIFLDEGRGAPYNQTHRVFRLLPSFKLLSLAELNAIFAATAPDAYTTTRALFDISKNALNQLSSAKTEWVNYEPPTTLPADRLPLEIRFDQTYDATGKPLALAYRIDGQPVLVNNVDSKFKNPKILFQTPVVNEGDASTTTDSRVRVYDFYGLDVNDPTRAPHLASDIITRDVDLPAPLNNIKRKTSGGVALFTGLLFDKFGHQAVGIQTNNCLVVRLNILPIALDAFNRPVKAPYSQKVNA